jgi:metal-responsive CopG/Arc/MetJ family transcriptional regulator
MKTAISIPDSLFEQAEVAAKELSISRSEFYARAVEAFLRAREQSDVTESLNRVYSTESSELDKAWAETQFNSIPREEW